jgi:mannose/cellobiose epimerase-like protein (N-acyl-D-glucosamine 2-epimerase family)
MHRVVILVTVGASLACGQANKSVIQQKMEKALHSNITEFWFPRSIDKTNGGYTISAGPGGESKGPGTKGIVTQARMLWFYARLARTGHRQTEMLTAAEHGFRFLRDKMWDRQNGGFYWEVDATGNQRIKPKKHLYGQAFALYALSEYYAATGRGEVLSLASRLFDLIERKAHDNQYGGYRESFREDWNPDNEEGYMGDSKLKLMNTHLHLMEAMAAYWRASKSPAAYTRLRELIDIQTNAVVRKYLPACTDKYYADWSPRLDSAQYARVSYGHDLENVWLIMDAVDAAGVPVHPFVDLFRGLWQYSLQYGFDSQRGGFYDSGPLGRPADRKEKVWWVQSEALVSALRMWKLTGDSKYLDAFEKTWQFVDQHQIDWTHGEWHSTILPDLSRRGDKADVWKAAYHNGRAMIECLELLRK